ncbi:MAG TPA: glycine--tRNA ligase, partial [Gemmatimonadales bacterium]|nr:glycine--tRNA ligase [Gemmatimonadales bacterium]
MADTTLMDKLVSLCKRRGFVFQSSEIYGGLGSVWDYGPLGVELKKNVKDRWWRAMVHARDDIEGLDAAILMHPRVWEASGHVAGFTDPLVDCRHCKNRFRADDARIKGTPGQPDAQCPVCGSKGTLTEPRLFNLMFKTFMGPVEEQAAVVYLRPETAQGIYVNYLNVLQSSRQRIPFGIAQIGKAFRNEITPGNFIFRTREFEQMEMQFFVKPGTDAEWFERWREWRMQWHRDLGLTPERLQWHQHGPDELAHYARAAFDIQYHFPFGWQEIEGIHNRGDFDLGRHQEYSGKKLEYFDQAANQRYGIRSENLRIREHERDELAHYAKRTADVEYQFPIGWSELMGIANRTDFDLKQHAKWSGKALTYFDEERKEHVVPYVIEPSAGVDRAL